MSNLLANPIVLTAVMNQSYKAATLASLGAFQYLLVEKVIWESPLTVGDRMIITDPNSGLVLLPATCEVAAQSQVFDWTPKPRKWSDFELTTLGSGTVYLFMA